ncbi:MAG: nitroreductase family protein [Thermoplasmatales archaeon]|nr:nitroreductase family protein [Thermoplasmatales archaeon]
MDLKEAIRNRHSVRDFSDKVLHKKIIDEIIEYANLAPSAGNLQARDFVIIDDNNVKEKLSNAAFNQKFIAKAPINIVVCANLKRISSYGNRGRELYCIQDASAAVEHILLLAVDNGLDACWVGAFDENKVSKILDLPSYVKPIAIVPIGYSNEQRTSTPRIDTNVLTHFNHW